MMEESLEAIHLRFAGEEPVSYETAWLKFVKARLQMRP
jgi:hypothetical protein